MKTWTLMESPFFGEEHYALATRVREWIDAHDGFEDHAGVRSLGEQCKEIARALGEAELLAFAVPHAVPCASPFSSSSTAAHDVRSICLIREALSYRSPLADFVFSMQGIGTAAIMLYGSDALKDRYLAPCRTGAHIAALALSEREGGSDVAATATVAEKTSDGYVINGTKAWISNGGIADHYIVIARTGEAPGARGLSAFIVDAKTPGLRAGANVDVISPHPLSEVHFENCHVPAANMLGEPGAGFKVAMATLDIFRSSVGAAALGLAKRALNETVERMHARSLFGKKMAEMDTVRSKVADMAVDTDAAALMVYRAAWLRDSGHARGVNITREAAMAKYVGTESAQRVIDAAVQLFGALGVTHGSVVERLYRDIRPMRIYEGASEVQKLIIGKRVLADGAPAVE